MDWKARRRNWRFAHISAGSTQRLAVRMILGCILVLVSQGTTCLFADSIVLLEGQTLTGKILVEKDTQLYLDIGVTVLAIPKAEILTYKYAQGLDTGSADANDANEPRPSAVEARADSGRLYRTADLRKTTISKSAEAVSQAVVKVSSPTGTGSGFFINEEGYLITNFHVIERETKIEVTMFAKSKNGFEKKRFKKVKIEAMNPFVDLALLKVEDLGGEKVKFAYLGEVERVNIGEQVFAVGNPLGLERTVTDGVVSTKNRAFEGLVYVQTNTDINPGNSGGPLFNLAGEVIGVTNMGYVFYGGLGFAIPVNYVRDFLDNREAFAYDKDNPNTGYKYVQPDKRRNKGRPEFLRTKSASHR